MIDNDVCFEYVRDSKAVFRGYDAWKMFRSCNSFPPLVIVTPIQLISNIFCI